MLQYTFQQETQRNIVSTEKCQRVGEIGGGPKSPKGAKIGESKKRALFNQSRDLQKPGAQMKMSPRTKKQSSK